MKNLLSRVERLESALKFKPVLIVPSAVDEQQARQDYFNEHGYMPIVLSELSGQPLNLRGRHMGTKDLLRRLQALENGDKAPSYLVDMLRKAQVKNGIDDPISPLISLGECLERFIALQPD
jgi:hypothetical protein